MDETETNESEQDTEVKRSPITKPRHGYNLRDHKLSGSYREQSESDDDASENGADLSPVNNSDEVDIGSRRRKKKSRHTRPPKQPPPAKNADGYLHLESTRPVVNSPKATESHSHALYSCIIVIVLIFAAAFVYLGLPAKDLTPDLLQTSSTRQQRVDIFNTQLEDIKKQFPSQTRRFWSVIKAAIQSNLKDEDPLYPAIVLLASNTDCTNTTGCLTKWLASLVRDAYLSNNIIEVTAERLLKHSKEGAAKLDLDNTLSEGFDSGVKVAVLKNLERTPAEVALMLHSYCDNENAPHRDVVFIFTVDVGKTSARVTEGDIEKKLSTSWATLDTDQYDAVWSRIGNNVAVTTQEDVALSENCKVV